MHNEVPINEMRRNNEAGRINAGITRKNSKQLLTNIIMN